MVKGGKWNEFIREIPVSKGDFIQIDPGTVHAIKGGMLILETQQNSDITYRMYDYDRLSNGVPRQLQIKQSLDVISVPAKKAEECVIHTAFTQKENCLEELYVCKYYKVFKAKVRGGFSFKKENIFMLATVIHGEGKVNGSEIKKGDHFLIPAKLSDICVEGNAEMILSTP